MTIDGWVVLVIGTIVGAALMGLKLGRPYSWRVSSLFVTLGAFIAYTLAIVSHNVGAMDHHPAPTVVEAASTFYGLESEKQYPLVVASRVSLEEPGFSIDLGNPRAKEGSLALIFHRGPRETDRFELPLPADGIEFEIDEKKPASIALSLDAEKIDDHSQWISQSSDCQIAWRNLTPVCRQHVTYTLEKKEGASLAETVRKGITEQLFWDGFSQKPNVKITVNTREYLQLKP